MLHLILAVVLTAQSPTSTPLWKIRADADLSHVTTRDARVSTSENPDGVAIRLETGHAHQWPSATFTPEDHTEAWDLSSFRLVAFEVRIVGDQPATLGCRLDDSDGGSFQKTFDLAPGEKKTIHMPLKQRLPEELGKRLFGMRGFPGGMFRDRGMNTRAVVKINFFARRPTTDHVFELANLRAEGISEVGRWLSTDLDELFPLIDRFGQFRHKSWPGKTDSIEDMARQQKAETTDLAARPGPSNWNAYGGWAEGPKLRSTGFFRVEKHHDKWWLVDPDGRLFWSHGIDCVRSTTGYTPITDREHLFEDLPDRDSPFGPFYNTSWWAPHGYYHDRGKFATYNFTGANLRRKYGENWKPQFDRLCHRRLRSWGMNTIGNWSDPEIYLLKQTPYVATVQSGGRKLEGSTGYWGKFRDVFDPEFEATLAKNMEQQRDKAAGDPWCMGFFIDNELGWGDEISLAVATLASPADQAAKKVFLADLKARYETIDRLNTAWNTDHASWDALGECTTPPDREKAREDLAAFYTKTAETYFRACRDAVKRVAPDQLYLGCRFAWVNDRAVRAAAKFCHVIGFNQYRDKVDDFKLPDGVDMPVVIGEFHFGALDRGMFHTGLRPVSDQSARATAYRTYVEGAIKNRYLVGTHWFQFGDQATTGRGDGENYQIGFVDICDTPYPETIEASRQVGDAMYEMRLEDGK